MCSFDIHCYVLLQDRIQHPDVHRFCHHVYLDD